MFNAENSIIHSLVLIFVLSDIYCHVDTLPSHQSISALIITKKNILLFYKELN